MDDREEFEFTGTIKFYDRGKLFGFIADDDADNPDIFFHITKIPNGYVPETGDAVAGFCSSQKDKDQDVLVRLTKYPRRETLVAPNQKLAAPKDEGVTKESKQTNTRFLGQWH